MAKGKFEDVFIGKFSLVNENAKIRKGVKIWNFCKIHECYIGYGTEIGSYCEIRKNAKIGNKCRLQSYVLIGGGTIVGNKVYVGPRVTVLNDRHPSVDGAFSGNWNLEKVIIEDEVVIGGGSILMPGIKIGKSSIIGAGSLVTKDIPPYEIWFGNVAKLYSKV